MWRPLTGRLESDPDSPKTYHNCELCVVRSGKGKRPEGYVEPPLEELAKLRRKDAAPAVPTEEASLAAAIEAAFPSRESWVELEAEEPRRRNYRRRGRGDGGGQPKADQPPQADQPKAEGKPSGGGRRRRRRPNKGGGNP